MTIAQQFLGKKSCKQQEEPLVPAEKAPNLKDAEEGRPVVVTMHAHVRRVSSLTTLCVFATALLVLTTGIIGGMYLYRHFAHYKRWLDFYKNCLDEERANNVFHKRDERQIDDVKLKTATEDDPLTAVGQSANLRHFRGWCSIPYLPDIQGEPSQPVASSLKHRPVATEASETKSPKVNFFEEEFDIDVKFEQYERIEVPSFEHGRRAQFVHDFVANKTGIVDYENRRCFVMVLNRNFVYPPRILYEQIAKMRAGYYDADTQTVRHTMQVVTPPISDLKNVGLFIARDCAQTPIYMLEKSTSPIYKRSLDSDSKKMFVEFAGNKVNEFNIVNIDEATPGGNSAESS